MATPRKQQPTAGAGPRRRILRIGVLLGGKIVEERLIRDRSAVSIGQSVKNTFSVPLETLPREWTLFAIDNDQYKLNFTPKMDGRVSDGAQVYTFEQVKGTKAQQHGDHWTMGLSDQARGKVSIGDLTLLFQFVTEPPVQPKPMLPASVRGTLAERIDPRLAVICAISIVLHFGIALFAYLYPREENRWGRRSHRKEIEAPTVDIATLQPVEVTPTEEKGEETQPGAEEAPKTDKVEKKPSGGNNKRPSRDNDDDGGGRKDAAALQEEAARYAAALASEGDSGEIDGRMSKTAPGGDVAQQLKEAKEQGGNVKVGGASGRGTKGDGDPRTGTGKGPKIDQPGGTGGKVSETKEEKAPKGRIQVASKKSFDDTTLSADAVLGKIQSAYMAGLKRCYKQTLKDDPSARGKAALSFEVNEKGRVTGANAKIQPTNIPSLASCIEGLMSGWTFPPPKEKGEDGEATTASFAVTLALQPE